jgi:hypothetical protein
MRTKELEIVKELFDEDQLLHYEKYIGTYVIKEWSFGEREQVLEEASDVQIDAETNKSKFQLKPSKTRIATIKACLLSAPFEVTAGELRDLPNWLGEYLYDEISELNEGGDDSILEKLRKK